MLEPKKTIVSNHQNNKNRSRLTVHEQAEKSSEEGLKVGVGPKMMKSSLFMGNSQLFFTLNRGTKYSHHQGHYIGEGATGDYVILIQKALNFIYKDDPGFTPLVEEKDFGSKTKEAVIKFQRDFGLKFGTNGVVGPETIMRLDYEVAKIEKMTFDPDEMFAIELINEAIKKRKPEDPAGAILYFWNWYHSLDEKPSFADLADKVMKVDFDYLNTQESKALMFGLSSGAATMMSLAGELDSPDAMDQLITMTEFEKEEAFLSSTEMTIAILLMEFGTGKGEQKRRFNERHKLTHDIMESHTTALAYRKFYDLIEKGKVREGVTYKFYQGYHNRASTKLESLKIHLQSLMLENYGEFFRGGMEYFFSIENNMIIAKATDSYSEDSGIRSGKVRERISGFETPFGRTDIEVRWDVPVRDVLRNFKGLDYYQKNKSK